MNFNQFINKQNIIMTEDEHNVYDFLKHHNPNGLLIILIIY